MLPGPVFNVELLVTARRARYFVLRGLYGLFLLYILWQTYESSLGWRLRGRQAIAVSDMADFAASAFYSFTIAQAIAVGCLTPVFFAGVIADEKQRRTLHYLMASDLTSAEIVLGKLAARFVHVLVFLGIALPIFSLLTLLGGVPPEHVLLADASTITGAWMLAGLSLLVSTVSRTVREAFVLTYALIFSWLVIPPLVQNTLRSAWPALAEAVSPINEWVYATNPIWLGEAPWYRGPGGTSILEPLAWMMGLQLACGSLFILAAVLILRPLFRAQAGRARRTSRINRRMPRLLARGSCGDDPMLWKELRVGRGTRASRWTLFALVLIALAILGYWLVYFTGPAIAELLQDGYHFHQSSARRDLNHFLRAASVCLYLFWGLGLAAASASSITTEREEDTWTSLMTTPLEPREVILAKLLGAAWRVRLIGFLMLGMWLLGLVVGSVHPVGLVVELIAFAVYSWAIAALGTYFSLTARNTTRALAATLGVLLFVNGGYLFCCLPLRPGTSVVVFGCSPAIIGGALVGHGETWSPLLDGETFATGLFSLVFYGIAAFGLTVAAIDGFDAAIDRPRSGDWASQWHRMPPAARSEGIVFFDKPEGPAADDAFTEL